MLPGPQGDPFLSEFAAFFTAKVQRTGMPLIFSVCSVACYVKEKSELGTDEQGWRRGKDRCVWTRGVCLVRTVAYPHWDPGPQSVLHLVFRGFPAVQPIVCVA